jgi:hypothetical protein
VPLAIANIVRFTTGKRSNARSAKKVFVCRRAKRLAIASAQSSVFEKSRRESIASRSNVPFAEECFFWSGLRLIEGKTKNDWHVPKHVGAKEPHSVLVNAFFVKKLLWWSLVALSKERNFAAINVRANLKAMQ